MKSLVLIVSIFVSSIALAERNPLMRTCRVNGGLFWALSITEPKNDQIGFCKYGDAMIGASSFYNFVHQNFYNKALSALKYSKGFFVSKCSDLGAKAIIGTDSYGIDTSVCVFDDYSFIKEETLISGWNSDANEELKSIILKYSSDF